MDIDRIEAIATDLVLHDRKPGICVVCEREADGKILVYKLRYGHKGRSFKKDGVRVLCRIGVGWKVQAGCCCDECLRATKLSIIDRIKRNKKSEVNYV